MNNLTELISDRYKKLILNGSLYDVTEEALRAGLQTITLFTHDVYDKTMKYSIDLDRIFSLVIVAVMQSDGHSFTVDFSSPFPDKSKLRLNLECDDTTPILTISFAN